MILHLAGVEGSLYSSWVTRILNQTSESFKA